MRRKIVVIGTAPAAAAAAALLRRRGDVDVACGEDALAGAALVVLEGGVVPRRLPQRAPRAVVVVLGDGGAVDAVVAATRFPRGRVLGAASVAASARAAAGLAVAAGVAPRDARVHVLGGDRSGAVPVLSLASVAGTPAAALLDPERVAAAVAAALEVPPDDFELAEAAGEVAAAVLDDACHVLACAVACHGEYGIGGAAVAVPCVVGAAGVERILELPLEPDELDRLGRSAAV